MHQLSFTFKRAHWSAVKFGQALIARVRGMTPARFDLLHCVRRDEIELWRTTPARGRRQLARARAREVPWILQRDLQRLLGVGRATLSKMLARLRDLGWVTTRRASNDQRANVVELTESGRVAIHRASKIIFGGHAFRRAYESMFAGNFIDPSRAERIERIAQLWSTADCIAKSLGDTSRLEYYFGWRDPDAYNPRLLGPTKHPPGWTPRPPPPIVRPLPFRDDRDPDVELADIWSYWLDS